jgi:DNA-binding PadR family transcriptional regulator
VTAVTDALSELEVLALAALVRLGPEAYGVTIRDDIEERTGRSVSVGSLYKALHRLEERRMVTTSVGEPTAVRGGRAKKHIHVEPAGRRALEASIRAWARMFDGLGERPASE